MTPALALGMTMDGPQTILAYVSQNTDEWLGLSVCAHSNGNGFGGFERLHRLCAGSQTRMYRAMRFT